VIEELYLNVSRSIPSGCDRRLNLRVGLDPLVIDNAQVLDAEYDRQEAKGHNSGAGKELNQRGGEINRAPMDGDPHPAND